MVVRLLIIHSYMFPPCIIGLSGVVFDTARSLRWIPRVLVPPHKFCVHYFCCKSNVGSILLAFLCLFLYILLEKRFAIYFLPLGGGVMLNEN